MRESHDAACPPELQVAVALLRRSAQPMAIVRDGESAAIHNAAFADLCGFESATSAVWHAAPSSWTTLLQPVVRPGLLGASQSVTGVRVERDARGDEDRWIDLSGTPLRDEAGGIRGVLVIGADATATVRAERALREERQARAETERRAMLLQTIFDASSDVIVAKDREGRLLFANPATLELFGRPAEDVIGRTDRELLPDVEAAEALMANDRRIMTSGVAEELEERVPRPDGQTIVGHARKMPWRVGDEVVGLLVVARDITERKRLQQQVADSNAALQRILSSITDGFAFLDREWRYTYFNEQGARLLDLRREDLVGRCMWEMFPAAATNAFGEKLRLAMETGQPTHFEAFYAQPLNRWIECHGYPSPDGLGVFFRDVTERHLAQAAVTESDRRLRRIFDANPIGMVLGETTGRILDANAAFLRLIGATRDELLAGGLRWDTITPPEHRDADRQAVEEVARCGVSAVYEKAYVHRDGHGVPVLVACARLSEEIEALVAFVIDISDRKLAEQRLRQADENKGRFIAVLAHELRNPLAPIRAGIALLQRDPRGEAARRTLVIMERQMRHIVRLTDDLLDVARIGTGKVELHRVPIDLRDVVHAAADAAQSQIDERGHALTVEVPDHPCPAEADHARMVQVVVNLLTNAARYTPKGSGRIRLALRLRSDGCAELVVADNGVGIAEGHLASVFDLFVQYHPAGSVAAGGLGIGLSLVRQLVEMHGGSVEARSDGPGRGSSFVVCLPSTAAGGLATGHAPDPADDAPPERSRRILLVDDNVDAVETLCALLEAVGHEVRSLHDGAAVLETARRFRPDVVLLDIGMPGRDGYEIAAELRACWELRDRAIVAALTGWGSEADRERSRRAGFDHHLAKPVDVAELERLIASRPVEGAAARGRC